MQIAADLADELMPRATVPWADAEGQLLQLIKFTDSKDNRVEVKTKSFINQKYRKIFKEWIPSGKAISEKRIGANTTTSDFDSPGVGSAVNQTQNMDSTVIGDLLDQKQQVLPLFDAVISSITTVQENADIYNDSFLIRNLEHVFLEETLAQFKIILANAKKYNITNSEINDLLQTKSHRAKQIAKEIEEGDDSNAAELDSMTIKKLQKTLEKKIKSRKDNLLTLLDVYGNADNKSLSELKKLSNKALNDLIVRSWRVSQMPLPESIKDSSLEPTDIAETGTSTGSETDAKQTEVASSQGDPGNANANIDEGQAAIDAIDQGQREAFEAEELAEQIENDKANVEADKKADAARELRQTLYTKAENKVLEIINRLDNKDTQVLVNDSIPFLAKVEQVQLNDDLAAPLISFNLNHIVDDYNRGMLYIQGRGIGLHDSKKTKESSEQKRRVFENVNIPAFREYIENTGGVTAYIEFIFQHELGHIVNKHHEIDTGGLLTPESVAKEIEANDYAFKAIGFNNVKSKIKSSESVSAEITGEENVEILEDSTSVTFEKRTYNILDTSVGVVIVDTTNLIAGKSTEAKVLTDAQLNKQYPSPSDPFTKESLKEILLEKLANRKPIPRDPEEGMNEDGEVDENIDNKSLEELKEEAKEDPEIFAAYVEFKTKLETGEEGRFNAEALNARIKELNQKDLDRYYDLFFKKQGFLQFIKVNKISAKDHPIIKDLNKINEELDNIINPNKSPFKDSENDVILSLENSVKKDLKRIYRTNSLRGNLQSIFETLGEASIDSYRNKDDKNTQQLQLQRVLDEIISKAGSELDRTQLTLNRSNVKSDGSANPTQTSVNVNINRFRPLSYSEQTSQEVYAHELIHILTRFAIKHDSIFKRKLEVLRDQVIAEIERTEVRPYEIFLNKDEQGKIIYKTSEQAEIDAAKKQYNYVFGDTVPAKYKLDEFLAYALTNKYIVAKTANMDSIKVPLWSKNENRRISEKVFEFFAELLNRVNNLISLKNKPLTVQQEIFELTRDIVDVNQSKRASLAKSIGVNIIAKGINRGNDEGAKLLAYAWSKGGTLLADTWIKMVEKATQDGKINNFLAKVLYDTQLVAYLGSSYKNYVDVHPDVQKKLNVIMHRHCGLMDLVVKHLVL